MVHSTMIAIGMADPEKFNPAGGWGASSVLTVDCERGRAIAMISTIVYKNPPIRRSAINKGGGVLIKFRPPSAAMTPSLPMVFDPFP